MLTYMVNLNLDFGIEVGDYQIISKNQFFNIIDDGLNLVVLGSTDRDLWIITFDYTWQIQTELRITRSYRLESGYLVIQEDPSKATIIFNFDYPYSLVEIEM